MTPFRAISVFYHVATLESVSAAADHLKVTPSAISQQLRSLEEQLGTALVTRDGRGIRLTEAGERYFDLIADQVGAIIAATTQMQGSKAATLLTIRSTPTISTQWLLPRLPSFLDANPDIDIRLDGTSQPADFSRDLVDLEIRHGIGRWHGLHVEPLVEERFLPVCAPALAAAGSLRPADLGQFRLIHSVKAQIQWTTWFEHLGLTPDQPQKRLYFDRSHMTVEAAVLGLGVALESNLMMGRELAEGRLVVPVADPPDLRISTQWIVCPHTHMRRSRVRRFVDWLHAQVALWQADNR